LTDKAQIDKYVSKAIVAGAKHDQHIVNLSQQLQHELGLVKVQGASTQTWQTQILGSVYFSSKPIIKPRDRFKLTAFNRA
jgi:hypothetical protein